MFGFAQRSVAASLNDGGLASRARALMIDVSRGAGFAAFAMIAFTAPAVADNEDAKPADPDTGESTIAESTLGLLPNPYERYGIKFAATYIGETLGNVSGGLKQGAVYEGRLNLAIDLDLDKLAGWKQWAFHANMFQIHGDGLSRSNVQNVMVLSGIEALPSTRLYEIWLEHKFGDKAALRFGQLAADAEFLNSKYADVFTNSSLGWPAIMALNLPSGGPSPPLAVPGARLRVDLTDSVTVLAAIFDGNAAGPGQGDPQRRDRYGLNFRLSDPPLVLGEIQYAWNAGKTDTGLPGTLKFGGWRHFGDFDDQRLTAQGLSLADPAGSGTPNRLNGNAGFYGVIEQKIYRVGHDVDRGIAVFGRIAGNPSDRNLIDLYADGGIEFIGLGDDRQKDKFGVAFGYAHVSRAARALDMDFQTFARAGWPVRSFEGLLTAAYQYEVRAGWNVQPSLQYIIHPGGGATDPLGSTPGHALKNALVGGVRTVLKF